MKKRIPEGGGWSDDVVTFFVSFDLEVSPHGAEMIAKKSRPEKFATEKIAAWQGSTQAVHASRIRVDHSVCESVESAQLGKQIYLSGESQTV